MVMPSFQRDVRGSPAPWDRSDDLGIAGTLEFHALLDQRAAHNLTMMPYRTCGM